VLHAARAAIADSTIQDLPELGSGSATLYLSEAGVVSKRSGERRSIRACALSGSVRAAGRGTADVELVVDPCSFYRIEVRGVAAPTILGIATTQGTLELEKIGDGPVELLLPPGRHAVYLKTTPRVDTFIDIDRETEDSGTFHLSVP